ncbi:hypothetical protein AARAC_011900 [Aspergillus arachidicola]|uniref:F-box domain-containing protein n=1 Tax=Aspergillus arachidicola TaxID=656916 RepID=A0A2G7GAY5_9EURO|nr:hypothetical protein AARAC_011900 [Aspergillus arachidicola]
MPLLELPYELLLQIIENLESEKDILSFLLTSPRIHAIQQVGPLYKHNIRFSGSSALGWFAARGRKSAVEALLEKGADLECKCDVSGTPLVYAAKYGHECVVRLLPEKGSIVHRPTLSWPRWTPLSWAVHNEHKDVVRLLLEKGSDPKFKGTEYDEIQLLGAAHFGDAKFVNLLLERGTDLECNHYLGRTPLSVAACHGQEAIVRMLLEKGADVESNDFLAGHP